MNEKKNIIGIGGANVDIRMKIDKDYILHDSNPGRMLVSAGGVTRNILDNLARLGDRCSLISAVGNDAFGDTILKACKASGIDISMIKSCKDHASSSYLSLIDGSGDMFVAACDASIIEELPMSILEEHRDRIMKADAIVCDTNWTEDQLKEIVRICKDVPIFIDPVSTEKAKRMKDISGSFYLIKPNRMELEVLSGRECLTDLDIEKACNTLLEKGTIAVVVSLGEKGCFYSDAKGEHFFASPKKTESMINASGAGDAFMAGLVHSYLAGDSAKEMVGTALACGSIAVMSEETINPEMSTKQILEYFVRL